MRAPAEALASGWPLALALATALLARRGRERRRTASLELALHELRRPLQALALCSADPVGSRGGRDPRSERVAGALAALGDLERAVHGAPAALRLQPVALRPLVEAAIERCSGGPSAVGLAWSAADATVDADPARVAQALDNLLENALEHGRPPVRVSGAVWRNGIRLVVMNAVRPDEGAGGDAAARPIRARARRRGHGLRIVAEIVGSHGGRFMFDRTDSSAMAMIELPLARRRPSPAPAAVGRQRGVELGAPAA